MDDRDAAAEFLLVDSGPWPLGQCLCCSRQLRGAHALAPLLLLLPRRSVGAVGPAPRRQPKVKGKRSKLKNDWRAAELRR